ncbi:MAG TPA: rRNA maturation RNase YbeY, partial [Spirochaeta sp.]|nr:rRNA maturation RNase YbeY [Spirochaeta sp.]
IEKYIQDVLISLDITDWEFSLLFSKDEYIAELNRDFRKKDWPTDVLTFCEADNDESWGTVENDSPYYAGDIIISIETLLKNSDYFGVDPVEELKRLIIHGILHLKGMDHDTNDSDEGMLLLQEDILTRFGEYKF